VTDSPQHAIFAGLVFNEAGEPAEIAVVGGEPCYVILDAGFRRHVEAEAIDRQVLEWLQQQIASNQELVSEGVMALVGEDDLFTKAMIDASIKDLDRQMEQLRAQGLPEGARTWLGMLGFRVVVDVHGQVVDLDAPSVADVDDW
jgi:hypothetical protein